jgi:hypothetical protein
MNPPMSAAETAAIDRNIVESFLYLRRGIGVIGLALPFVLVFGHDLAVGRWEWRESMSSYYYTDMRNILVGAVCAIGVVLFCYRYDALDNVLSNIAGVCAVGVALFPTASEHPSPTGQVVSVLHAISAATLLLIFAWFCFGLFTRADPVVGQTARKTARNRIYRICGTIIVIAVALAVVGESPLVHEGFRDAVHPLLWCEWAAVAAFGAAWLIKGRTLVAD